MKKDLYCNNGGKMFAQQTVKNLPSYRPNVLTTFQDSAIADRATLVSNDGKTTLVPQYLSALVPSKRIAFTLAEVLITLGIIGVVAAMTMPTLIQNHQKQVYVNQLKKAMSTVENGFRLMMADDGVDKISDTQFFQEITDANGEVDINKLENSETLKKYFNIIEYGRGGIYLYYWHKAKMLNGSMTGDDIPPGVLVQLNDGSNFDVYHNNYGNLDEAVLRIVIDVNGLKKPNQFGRDIFSFGLGNEGILNGNMILDLSYSGAANDCSKNGTGGECGKYLLENSFVMDY